MERLDASAVDRRKKIEMVLHANKIADPMVQ